MQGNGMEVRGRWGCTGNGQVDGMMIVVMRNRCRYIPSAVHIPSQWNAPNSQLVQVTTSTSTTPM
jgi:hypothetical protein